MKEKLKNKKIILKISSIALIVVSLLVLITMNRKGKLSISNSELARAMTYDQVQDTDKNTNVDNVKFDAFFLRDINADGYAEGIRGTCKEIGKEDTLYMEINVQTAGYLKDAKITINGQNFYLQTALPKDEQLKDNYIGNNTKEILFNSLANGTQKLITGKVRSGDYTYNSGVSSAIGNDTSKYSKQNEIVFTGTYVGEDGVEIEVNKTINFMMDWYGATRTSIYSTNQTRSIENIINQEKQTVNLGFNIDTRETMEKLNISKSYVEGTVPELNGYAPIEVKLVGDNGKFTYDEATRKFTVERNAVLDENGKVTSSVSRYNNYGIQVVYPLEAYQSLGTEAVEIRIPVETYYEGYNNPNTEFTNPYKSNVVRDTIIVNFERPKGTVSNFDITVGKYLYSPTYRYVVSKQKPLRIYNGMSEKETNDTYLVTWYGYVGTNEATDGLVMKEKSGQEVVSDKFIKADSTGESMENVTKNVGIYFGNTTSILGEEGWIKVYDDDTDELLVTFDKSNLSTYTSSNPYYYAVPVKHIRVETSEAANEKSLYVYNIKELDDEYIVGNYTREEFDNLKYIKSTLNGYIGDKFVETDVHKAVYEAPISVAKVGLSKNVISTQATEKNEKITIWTECNESNNEVKWLNGAFLLKMPEEILDIEINNVQINNTSVRIDSYEVIEKDGIKFIKIVTSNTTEQSYEITIDANISSDPRKVSTTKNIELYASNENGSDYHYKGTDIYDVNNNLNVAENINKTSTNIQFVSPSSLLTNQIGSEYDNKGTVVISPQIADIKPQLGVVDQNMPEKTAKIGIQLKNNYANTISEVVVLGKIPFEGNTYVISGGDLGSNFTTKMTNTGITLPEELVNIAKVYYSENVNPSKDLEDKENGWKTADQVENWDNIKTFLIDLSSYVMPQGKELLFNYVIKIPNGLEYNKVAFSHHGVYFSLDTEEGKYRTQTEPNRIGFRIAEKYNLELNKYQTGKNNLIPGATYKITEEGQAEGRTAVTNAEGKLEIRNLYVEKTYRVEEIKVPTDYELSTDVIRFIGHVDENGNLIIEKLEGNPRGNITVEKLEGEDYKVILNVEDEAKAKLKLIKKEQGTENKLIGIRYKVTGYGLPENGRTLTTNIDGEINLRGLSINQEYTLQEVKAEGYYLASQIRFKIVNTDGVYSVEVLEGTAKSQSITEENDLPTANIEVEDEKIPTYDLEITKIKRVTPIKEGENGIVTEETTYLQGAKFKLYKDGKELGEYISGIDGKIIINNLYQYVDGKDFNATYVLKEVLAPDGYAKVKDITFKVQEIDGKLNFVEELQEGQLAKKYTVEGNVVKVTVEDSPSFKLVKKDGETGELLANVKFAIYNVDDGEVPAKNSKGEIIGTKEVIDGTEYYTVVTDAKGELILDLAEGLYKALEVEAPEKYDIEESVYYFGIGGSREGKKKLQGTAVQIGADENANITSMTKTKDGGYIAGGYFEGNNIQIEDQILNNNGNIDGMIIKYNSNGIVEWIQGIGGQGSDYVKTIKETSDGGCIIGGYFNSSDIKLGDITIKRNGAYDGILIKYNSDGVVEWAQVIGGNGNDYVETITETGDGGYIVGGYFESTSIQVGNITLTNNQNVSGMYKVNGMLIKYNNTVEVEWAKEIAERNYNYVKSVTEISNGGYIVARL